MLTRNTYTAGSDMKHTITSRNHSYHKGHAALFYATLEERLRFLADYFQAGLAHDELCVLVTPGPESQTIEDFDSVGFNVRPAIDEGALRVFRMYDTYMPDGFFAPNSMLENVAKFIEESKNAGFSGLRTAGDMRWINVYPDCLDAAAHYEDNVNGLESDHSFMGLCLYPLIQESSDILKAALSTHPAFIYDGMLRLNPYTANGDRHEAHIPSDVRAFTELLASV